MTELTTPDATSNPVSGTTHSAQPDTHLMTEPLQNQESTETITPETGTQPETEAQATEPVVDTPAPVAEAEPIETKTLPVEIPEEIDPGHETSGLENPVEAPAEEELTVENAEAFLEDEHEQQADTAADAAKEELTGLGKAELLKMAAAAASSDDLSESSQTFRKIRPQLDMYWNADYQAARARWIEEGHNPEDFKHTDESKDEYHSYYKQFTAKRDAYKQKQEEEKKQNLVRKKAILDRIKHLAENDETDGSLEEIKNLQNEWKAIKLIPAEERETLWHNYQHYLNTFYDNHHINNELKDLDRKKNLEAKMDLCRKMDELKDEKSLRKALVLHKKYWEEWKNTGPVPREAREPIWLTFKEAADVVFNAKMEELKAMDSERQANLDAKVLLCEKAEELAVAEMVAAKDWAAKVTEVNALFDEWKKIGQVSIKYHESIWERFKAAVDKFYAAKNAFFKNLEKQRADNLKLKRELCDKAEALQNSDDWGNTSRELRHLQDEWKKIGPVMEKYTEAIWQRFRTACDKFFEAKNEHFAGQQQDQAKNLEAKQEILGRLNELAASEDNTDLPNRVKALQDEWNSYGFVPLKQKEQISKHYKDALDKIYNRIRKDFAANTRSRNRNHYEVIARQPEGKNMLVGEERRMSERIRLLRADIDTWQNNIGFFANSKNAAEYTKQINKNIEEAQAKLSKLLEQMRVLRDVKSGKPATAKKETAAKNEATETAPELPEAE